MGKGKVPIFLLRFVRKLHYQELWESVATRATRTTWDDECFLPSWSSSQQEPQPIIWQRKGLRRSEGIGIVKLSLEAGKWVQIWQAGCFLDWHEDRSTLVSWQNSLHVVHMTDGEEPFISNIDISPENTPGVLMGPCRDDSCSSWGAGFDKLVEICIGKADCVIRVLTFECAD